MKCAVYLRDVPFLKTPCGIGYIWMINPEYNALSLVTMLGLITVSLLFVWGSFLFECIKESHCRLLEPPFIKLVGLPVYFIGYQRS